MLSLLSDLESGQESIYSEYNQELIDLLEDLAIDQSEFEAESINNIFENVEAETAVNRVAVSALYNNPLQIQNYSGEPLVRPFIKDLTANQIGIIQTKIRQGYAQGRTTDQITRDIIGTRSRRFKDGEMARVKRSNRALVHTSIQHASTQGRHATMKKNNDVLTGYEWVSTLDSKTTQVCRSLDGREFKEGKGPLPPIHVNCRSITVPVVDKRYNLLSSLDTDRPSVGSSGAKSVDSNQTYYSWLKTQPSSFQDSAIGDTRGKLLREGGLSADEFANLQLDKNFEPLTLEQMKAKRPEVFERAGI